MPLNRLMIRKPLISEKATELASQSKYVFMVDPRANKNQAKELIEEIYDVTVIKTNMIRMKRKSDSYKKVIVTLKEGDTIDIVPH